MSIIMPGNENKYDHINPDGSHSDVENVWNERHDISATQEAIQQMLAGETPNWVRWPQDYKDMAKEDFASHRENSEKMASGYKWADQKMLTDKAARQINGISTRDFIEKLRRNGIKCAVFDNQFVGPGGIPTVGLWCVPPNRTNKIRPVCYLDVPMMWEWSVLKLDAYGIPAGEGSRGWRTVAVQLVEKGIITEQQCHKIFPPPPPNQLSARYYRSLWEVRHRKAYEDNDEQNLTD
jgi:hypothetical protein